MNSRVWLSLGSNLGDRAAYLRFAVTRLQEQPRIKVRQISSLYRTEPWGVSGQEDYYNAAVGLETDFSPQQLLSITQAIESEAGRCRQGRWQPRQLDLDILLFDDLELTSESLTIPHPYLGQRAFVLLPLLQIAGDLTLPGQGRLSQLLAALPQAKRVEKIAEATTWYQEANDEDN